MSFLFCVCVFFCVVFFFGFFLCFVLLRYYCMIPCSSVLPDTCLSNADCFLNNIHPLICTLYCVPVHSGMSVYVCSDAVYCNVHVTLLKPAKRLHLTQRTVMFFWSVNSQTDLYLDAILQGHRKKIPHVCNIMI